MWDSLGLWGRRSDLGLASGQLTTMQFYVYRHPGCLVALADSEGCNPNPSLQDAEMIKLVITRLHEGPAEEPPLSLQLQPVEGVMSHPL